MNGYFNFFRENKDTVGFGYLLTFFSSFGQTFLISLYVPDILREFQLSNSLFGTYYAFATVAASVIMLNIGHTLDYKSTRSITVFTTAGLAISTVLWGLAVNHVLLLIALVGLRLTGQGMMGHISITVLSRYFIKERGKALSLASLGYSMGEALFPAFITFLIISQGWRFSAIFSGLLLVLLFFPVLQKFSLEKFDEGHTGKTPGGAHQLWSDYGKIILDHKPCRFHD